MKTHTGGARKHGAPRTIKRYANRKLYEPALRRHVTLNDVAEMVARGDDVQVEERGSGEDVTNTILAQVLLESIRDRTASIPRSVLTRLIRLGTRGASWPHWSAPQAAATRAKEEAEQIAAGLLSKGRLTLEEALALRQDVARSVQGIVSDAQKNIEQRLRHLLDSSERESGVTPALQALKARLLGSEDAPRTRPRQHTRPSAARRLTKKTSARAKQAQPKTKTKTKKKTKKGAVR